MNKQKFYTNIYGELWALPNGAGIKGKLVLNKPQCNEDINIIFDSDACHDVTVGYRLPDGEGEYIWINIQKGIVTFQTDQFGSHALFLLKIPGKLVFSSDMHSIISKYSEYISIDNEQLLKYFVFGYPALDDRMFYTPITLLEADNVLKVSSDQNSSELQFESYVKSDDMDISIVAGMTAVEILQHGILQRINYLGDQGLLHMISAGYDSGILLQNFRKLGISVRCVTQGRHDCDDVLIGRERAKSCGYEHFHCDKFNSLDQNQLFNLLGEYSYLTSGIGPIPEINTLSFFQEIKSLGFVFLFGEGGEFFRNRLQGDAYFKQTYMTPVDEYMKYLRQPYSQDGYINRIKSKYGNRVDVYESFYMKEKHPKNLYRKYSLARQYGLKATFLTNKYLLNFIYSQTTLEYRNTEQVMHDLLPSELYFELKHDVKVDYLSIDNFYDRIGNVFLNYSDGGYDLNELGIDHARIVEDLKNKKLTLKGKWFISRILNLFIYLSQLKKQGIHLELGTEKYVKKSS